MRATPGCGSLTRWPSADAPAVYLGPESGDLDGAVALSVLLTLVSLGVLLVVRLIGD